MRILFFLSTVLILILACGDDTSDVGGSPPAGGNGGEAGDPGGAPAAGGNSAGNGGMGGVDCIESGGACDANLDCASLCCSGMVMGNANGQFCS
jgi:hypothetical protein